MTKGCIFYTDNLIEEPILSIVRKHIMDSGLPVVSSSLRPIDFGGNHVVNKPRGYATMIEQIIVALEHLESEIVFFTEHDVLYPKCHFDFTPEREDIFYYNQSIWRWDYPNDFAITYQGLNSLSGLCCYRKLALDHYQRRWLTLLEKGFDKIVSKEPSWGRKWGYEPGTKKKRRGGFSDEDHSFWFSEIPIVDIRHEGTYTRTKVSLSSFKHPPDPSTWRETTLDKIPGWELKKEFGL